MRTRNVEKLYQKARQCIVAETDYENRFTIISPSGGVYEVNLEDIRACKCDCTWGVFKEHSGCSHVIAAFNRRESLRGREVMVFDNINEANRQYGEVIPIEGFFLVSRRVLVTPQVMEFA